MFSGWFTTPHIIMGATAVAFALMGVEESVRERREAARMQKNADALTKPDAEILRFPARPANETRAEAAPRKAANG